MNRRALLPPCLLLLQLTGGGVAASTAAVTVVAPGTAAATVIASSTTAHVFDAQTGVPDCKRCRSTGKQPCSEHPKGEIEGEDALLYCSAIADCAVCGGTGFILCSECKNEVARAALEQKRALVQTRRVALKSLDDTMGRPLRKAESAHFVLVWEMDSLKVDKRHLNAHELVHLYLKRLEDLYANYCARLSVKDEDFREKCRVFVWGFEEDQVNGSLRFCKQSGKNGVKLMGINPSYSVCGNKVYFQNDEKLHRNIVHCVSHLLLSAQSPVAWIGNMKAGWADEGLAHWFEDYYFGICDNYCFQEANTNVDFKAGKYRLAMRKMVVEEKVPSIAEVLEQNSDTLKVPMHCTAFSYVDYLLSIDGAKLTEVVKKLKAKVPAREAFNQIYGFGPFEFETQWKAWVLATYPTR